MDTGTPRIGAIILAGGGVPTTLTAYCTHRALLRLHGRFLLEYMLDALTGLPSIARIAIVTPRETRDALAGLPAVLVDAADTLIDNMLNGARALDDETITHTLFLTGDVPLVTSEGIDNFIQASIAGGGALSYPIIPRTASEARFPGASRTYVRLREGAFTGGNAILTAAHLLDDKREIIQELYTARKNPLKLARLFGWPVVLRLLLGTLSVSYMETVAGRILGAPARAIVTEHAEIGFDVDKADDLSAVERAFAPRTATNDA